MKDLSYLRKCHDLVRDVKLVRNLVTRFTKIWMEDGLHNLTPLVGYGKMEQVLLNILQQLLKNHRFMYTYLK